MKIRFPKRQDSKRAFTLTEMIFVVMIFSMLVGAMVAIQLFAMRVYTLSATKLTSTADARQALNAMRDQIRSANVIMVGNYSGGFTQVADGQPQVGNALAIQYTNAAATNYLVFFKDAASADNTVCSISNGVTEVLAKYVTNSVVFEAEDYQGIVLTNYQNNPVIKVTLQFYQWEYPIAMVGDNGANAYNFYQLRTRIARREK
ncbi:MAG TPA: type II secretion system protein [Verrucomicrobiae bacterium]|nr:type II secretion system protein [Verrucomicrobiae bacterium]